MPNETIVLNASNFFVNFDGVPIDGFPDAGTIATDNKVADEADYVGALNGSGVAVINGSKVREVVVNVIPFGFAHAAFSAGVFLQSVGGIHSFSMQYTSSEWLSSSCVVRSLGTTTINADGVEFVPITIKGLFTKFSIAAFVAPSVVTPEQLLAAIQTG